MLTDSDNCKSKYGRRRPFLVCTPVLYGIVYLMLFIPPEGIGPGTATGTYVTFTRDGP